MTVKVAGEGAGATCCIALPLVLAFNLWIGGMSVRFLALCLTGAHIPWLPSSIAGLFLGEFTVPAALFCWLMTLCGVHAPFMH